MKREWKGNGGKFEFSGLCKDYDVNCGKCKGKELVKRGTGRKHTVE
jgi:hypothetical protein